MIFIFYGGLAYGIIYYFKKCFGSDIYCGYGLRYEPYVLYFGTNKRIEKLMKIENITSRRGNYIPNQFKLYYNDFVAFQSYETLISVYDVKNDTMYTDQDFYSTTTSKYRNLFNNEFQPLAIIQVDNEQLHRIIERG